MTSRVEGPSDLTPLQRKALRNFHEYCAQPPTMAMLLRKSLLGMGLLQAYLVGLGLLLFFTEMEVGALILWGMAVGVITQQCGSFRAFLRIWPAIEAIIDRDRLDELVAAPRAHSDRDHES